MSRLRSPVSALILYTLSSMSASAADLSVAFKDATKNDPQTLKAKAQYEMARESKKIVFSNLLPNVNFSANYAVGNTDQYTATTNSVADVEYDTLSYGVSLSQAIFRMDTWHQLDAEEKRALQAQVGYDLSQQALVFRVVNAYFNVLKSQDTLEFIRSEKRAIERQLEQTKQRFKVGLTAITDVHEAQANFDNAVAREIKSNNDVEIAKELLREITGAYYKDFSTLNTDKFEASLPSPAKAQDWLKKAESNNLELKAKELVIEAAKHDISRAKSGHYPMLNLNASLSSSDTGGDFNSPRLDSNSISLNLVVPIYAGGGITSAVKQAQANYVYVSQDREATHRAVVRQVRSSFADVVALVSTLKAIEQSVVSAESALQATQAGFDVGTRTIVDVLNSTKNLYNAKNNLSSTRYDYILSMLLLKQASGTLNGSDIEAINKGLL